MNTHNLNKKAIIVCLIAITATKLFSQVGIGVTGAVNSSAAKNKPMLKYNKSKLYFFLYVLLAFCFGFYWYTVKAKLHSLEISIPYIRFILRFTFGLGYLVLAMIYCQFSNKYLYFQVVTQIYMLFELIILAIGLFRYFIFDHAIIITLYSTLLGVTVSPLGLLLTHVIISLKQKKSILEI